jgi:uncharacterized damage-inducible protein DinB
VGLGTDDEIGVRFDFTPVDQLHPAREGVRPIPGARDGRGTAPPLTTKAHEAPRAAHTSRLPGAVLELGLYVAIEPPLPKNHGLLISTACSPKSGSMASPEGPGPDGRLPVATCSAYDAQRRYLHRGVQETSMGGVQETSMDEKSLFTKFWEDESKTTRKVIARIPEGSDYRPDPKSRTASEIAWQIVCEEKGIIEALETGRFDWAPPPAPATMKELLEVYDRQSADIVRRWKALPAARWGGSLEFFGGQRPASPMAWSFLFDLVHHRGQVTTYLRPMGSTVPQVYGPSADEP